MVLLAGMPRSVLRPSNLYLPAFHLPAYLYLLPAFFYILCSAPSFITYLS